MQCARDDMDATRDIVPTIDEDHLLILNHAKAAIEITHLETDKESLLLGDGL